MGQNWKAMSHTGWNISFTGISSDGTWQSRNCPQESMTPMVAIFMEIVTILEIFGGVDIRIL